MIFSAAVTAASSSKSRMAFFNSSMQATFAIEVTSRSVDTEKGFCSSFALESFRRAHPHYRAWLPGQPPDLNAAIHSDSAYRPLPPAIEYFSFNQTWNPILFRKTTKNHAVFLIWSYRKWYAQNNFLWRYIARVKEVMHSKILYASVCPNILALRNIPGFHRYVWY